MTATAANTLTVTERKPDAFGKRWFVRYTDYRKGGRVLEVSRTRKGIRHLAWHNRSMFIQWPNGKLERTKIR